MHRLCVPLVFVTAAAATGQLPAPTDRDRLQGTWEAVELTVQGRPVAAKGFRLQVKGDTMTITANAKGEHTFHLDPKATPRALDLTPTTGPVKGQRTPVGIYEWDGDRLRLCLDDNARREADRPKEFKSTTDKASVLAVLKRVKE
jgi:uncharacterized protein (TIGR03067 family)